MKALNYHRQVRHVSPEAYEASKRTGLPAFTGRFKQLVDEYTQGDIDKTTLINLCLVEMTND